jgi:hypothetical protein
MAEFLYRGVSNEFYEKLNGELRPKEFLPFARKPKWGKAVWGNSKWGESDVNGVIEHQLHQAGYPTSGVSTTPHIERAMFYATHASSLQGGYIYVIDRSLLAEHGVASHVVTKLVNMPTVPEDDEVILVASNYSIIPNAVIVECVKLALNQGTGHIRLHFSASQTGRVHLMHHPTDYFTQQFHLCIKRTHCK